MVIFIFIIVFIIVFIIKSHDREDKEKFVFSRDYNKKPIILLLGGVVNFDEIQK